MAKRKRGKKRKRKGFSYTSELRKYSRSEIERVRAMQKALNQIARDMALRSLSR